MHRQLILQQLRDYENSPWYDENADKKVLTEFFSFISKHPDCFERDLLVGHLTASCWILNQEENACLLTHHKKLGKWLQLGGHADGDLDLLQVALKEGYEESGLKDLKAKDPGIFDLSIHSLPPFKGTPAHLHYDVRFLFEADSKDRLKISEESNDLKWVPLSELERYTQEESVLKMRNKFLTITSNS